MPYKVLLASDSQQLKTDIYRIFSLVEDEFTIKEITDIEFIISFISEEDPDLILYDIHFENSASTDILKIIKADPKSADIPILAIVDFLQPEIVQQIFNAGADDFIGRPINTPELIQRTMVGIQRGRMLKKLKTLSSHFDSITTAISQAGNSVIIIDSKGEITWVNEGFKRLYECTLDYFKSVFGDNLFASNVSAKTADAFKRCLNGEYVIYESNWVTPNGKTKFIQTSLTPVFDDLQNLSHVVAIEMDITDLKIIEKNLADKNEHLQTITESLEEANKILEEQQLQIQKQSELLAEEKQKTEALLLNILPLEVANALQKKGFYKPKKFKEVSVMFADFVGFSKISKTYENIIDFLNVLSSYFEAFDEIITQRYIEKIKTIGDAYMCVGGVPRSNHSHPFDTVLAALELQKFVKEKAKQDAKSNKPIWAIRVGIHTGSVIAGVIGKHKFAYDIWGDTVNVASRMETACEPGKINISETTYSYIKDYFICTPRGKIPAKNIGEIEMYFVKRIKPEYSEDTEGYIPNNTLKKIVSSL